MQVSFSDEQEQFRAGIRRFLTRESPTAAVRALMATGHGWDREVWKRLCNDLGVAGLQVPEAHGGSGFGLEEVGIVMEEMGRNLACTPFFTSAVLATRAILDTATPAQADALLADLLDGSRIATLAVAEAAGQWTAGAVQCTATPDGDGHARLDGSKHYVLDGATADLLVVAARAPAGVQLFAVPADAPGVTRVPLDALDPTRKLARIDLAGARGERLGADADADASAALAGTLGFGAIALACESAGGARAMLDSAVAYTGIRTQFGRTVASFQAIKHRCADLLLEVELARAAACYAAAAAAAADPETPVLAALAKACTSEAFVNAAATCIQLHGGIGFTWDHDTHLWFKRAKASEVLLGDPAFHREQMLVAMGV